jgi:hypothetical protein
MLHNPVPALWEGKEGREGSQQGLIGEAREGERERAVKTTNIYIFLQATCYHYFLIKNFKYGTYFLFFYFYISFLYIKYKP